jgi:hypothetical protein
MERGKYSKNARAKLERGEYGKGHVREKGRWLWKGRFKISLCLYIQRIK